MTSNVHSFHELKPRIIVMGVGGAGGNAVNNMIASGLHGVEFVAANTDAQALSMSGADVRLQLGANLTEGLGAGSNPEIGEGAAEEVLEEVKQLMAGAHMVFIACGMGGGTGTGAAPVIARIAQELGVLTVAVVTKPFQFEGQRRMRIAEAGIEQLRNYVDTMIVIPNQNLFRLANEQTTFAESFCLADSVLNSGVACVTDLIMKEGLINLDFADVKTVITEMGAAVMGTGVAHGEGRARKAAEEAISNPLIDDISLAGAKGLLISISGGHDMTLFEVDEVASRIRQEVDPNANIIVGATFDEQLEGYLRVSLVASGLNHGHPQSMHIEADRRRMENDNREEENNLGLNERIQQMEEPIGRPVRFGGPMQKGGPQGQGIANQAVRGIPAAKNMGDVYSPPAQNRQPGGVDMAGGNGKAPVSQPAPQGEFGRRGAPKGQSKADGAFSEQKDAEQKGNVQIVKKPPRFMNDGAETSFSNTSFADGGSYDGGMDGRTTGREFVPGAPQKVNQPMQPARRMPSMEDLPITGQKQLRAYEAPSNNHGIVAQKKKVGFFDRITGRNKSQDNEGSEEGGDSEPSPVAEPSPDFVAGPPQRAATPPPHRPADIPSGAAVGRGRGVADERGSHAGHHMPPEETSYYGQRPPPAAPEVPVQRPEHRETAPGQDQAADKERPAGARIAGSGEKTSAYDELLKRVDHTEQSEQRNDYAASEFEQQLQAHYNQHPQPQPQSKPEEDAAPLSARPETAQERYPTIEIKKGLGHPLSLEDDEDISDIPPFLKKKS